MNHSRASTRIGEHVRSNVVGYIALVCFAFMGTAQALPGTATVDSGDIKNNTVQGKDVHKDSLKSNDVGELTGEDFLGNALILNGSDSTTGVYGFEMRVDGNDGDLAQIGQDFLYVRSNPGAPMTLDGSGFINFTEATTPAAPGNAVRLFARDIAGKTELVAIFPGGDEDQIAVQD